MNPKSGPTDMPIPRCEALTAAGKPCGRPAVVRRPLCARHAQVQDAPTPQLFCPNCSLPRRRLHYDGEVWKCTQCKSWWNPHTVRDPRYAELFTQGGPAGYDPETGFECQDHPRGDASRQLKAAR